MIRLKVPADCSGISWDGENYPAVNGVVEVPGEAMRDLAPHGFEVIENDGKSTKRTSKKASKDEEPTEAASTEEQPAASTEEVPAQ